MGAKKTFPLEEVQKLVDDGLKIVEIAEHFGVSRVTMGKFLRENNIKTLVSQQRLKAGNINEQEVANEYKKGANLKELAEKHNVSTTVIKRCLNTENVKLRNNSESHSKFSLDINYFNEINTMNKAYILGFICADGYITDRNEIGIGLKLSDIDMLYFFLKELKSNKEIYFPPNKNSCIASVQNQYMANILKKYSIVPRKSLILNIKEVIQAAGIQNSDLEKAFLLGYFDGDGGFTKSTPTKKYSTVQYGLNITGTYETCIYYQEYFDNIGFLTKRHEDEKNNFTYRIGGRNRVKTAMNKLYIIKDQLDFFYMRKYNIFKEL